MFDKTMFDKGKKAATAESVPPKMTLARQEADLVMLKAMRVRWAAVLGDPWVGPCYGMSASIKAMENAIAMVKASRGGS